MSDIVFLSELENNEKSSDQLMIDELLSKLRNMQEQYEEIQELDRIANIEIEKNRGDIEHTIAKIWFEIIEKMFLLYNDNSFTKNSAKSKNRIKDIIHVLIPKYKFINRNRANEIIDGLLSKSEKNDQRDYLGGLAEEFKKESGIDIDIDDFLNRPNSEEENLEYKDKYNDFIAFLHRERMKKNDFFGDFFNKRNHNFEDEEHYKDFFDSSRKKKKEKEDDAKKMDIETIFKAIIKQIHPDREQDENIRSLKEKIVVKIAEARKQQDLSKMITIVLDIRTTLPNIKIDIPITRSSYKQLANDLNKQILEIHEQIQNCKFDLKVKLLYSVSPKSFTKDKIEKQAKKIKKQLILDLHDAEWVKENLITQPKVVIDKLEDELLYDYFF